MNNFTITNKFDKIEYGGKTYDIIKSPQPNNQLITSLLGYNKDSSKILMDRMPQAHFSPEVMFLLSKVGAFQFTDDLESNVKLFEYYSIINNIDITSIIIPKGVNEVTLINSASDEESKLDVSYAIDCNKLLLFLTSPVKNLDFSEIIHNNMLYPHQNTEDKILLDSDQVEFINTSHIKLVNLDSLVTEVRYKLTNTKLADNIDTYLDAGQNEDLYSIKHLNSNEISFIINGESILV